MRFDFATATRILFGPGTIRELESAARSLGKRALVVTGRDPDRVRVSGVDAVYFPLSGEPAIDDIRRGVAEAGSADLVIGIGGGSAIDAAKAIAAMLANGGDPLDYLEVIGKGLPVTRQALPCIAIPTTSGTGSEVTRNSVLASPQHRVKASLRSPSMLPRLAIVDPELTLGLPPAITASTGLDALTQVIEPAEKTAPFPADSTIDSSAPPSLGLSPLASSIVPGVDDLEILSVSWPEAPPGTRSWSERSPNTLPSARPVPSKTQCFETTTR